MRDVDCISLGSQKELFRRSITHPFLDTSLSRFWKLKKIFMAIEQRKITNEEPLLTGHTTGVFRRTPENGEQSNEQKIMEFGAKLAYFHNLKIQSSHVAKLTRQTGSNAATTAHQLTAKQATAIQTKIQNYAFQVISHHGSFEEGGRNG